MRNDHAVFIGRSFRLGQQPPMGYQFLSLIEAQDNISITDIDG
jgi:hypothetical protein